jgi:hypothetical protein
VISCELVLLSIVMNYIGYVLLYVVCYILLILEAPHLGEVAKTGSSKKIKILTDEYNRLCSSVHRLADEYKGHASSARAAPRSHGPMRQIRGRGPAPQYICW